MGKSGRSAAVLMGVRAYQAMVEELEELRDVHRGLSDAKAGQVTPHEDALEKLRERYRK